MSKNETPKSEVFNKIVAGRARNAKIAASAKLVHEKDFPTVTFVKDPKLLKNPWFLLLDRLQSLKIGQAIEIEATEVPLGLKKAAAEIELDLEYAMSPHVGHMLIKVQVVEEDQV